MAGYSKYPQQLDSSTELPYYQNRVDEIRSEICNRITDSIKSIQSALGTMPQGISGSVANRLNSLESILNSSGGDFSNFLTLLQQIQGDISALESSDASLNAAVSSLVSSVSALQGLTSTHSSQITTLNSNVSALQGTSSTHTSQISSLTTTSNTHTSQIGTLNTTATSLQNQIFAQDNDITAVENDIVSIEAELLNHENRITNLELNGGGGSGSLDGYVSQINANSAAIQNLINILGNSPQGAFPTVAARFTDIESDIAALVGGSVPGLDGYLTLINSINTKLGNNPQGLFPTVQDRLNDVDSDLNTVNSHFISTDGYVNTLATRIGSLESRDVQLSNSINTNTTNIGTNTTAISTLLTRLGTNFEQSPIFTNLADRLNALGSYPIEAFVNPISIDKFATVLVPRVSSFQFIATSTQINGFAKVYVIEPYSVEFLSFSSQFQILEGEFDTNKKNIIRISCIGSQLFVEIFSYERVLDQAPYLYSATIPTAQSNSLRLHFDKAVTVLDLTGISLSFSSGTPKTITGVRSGIGTSTLYFDLSGNVLTTDVLELVLASNHNIKSGLQVIPQTISVGWYTEPKELSGTFFYWDIFEGFTVSQWDNAQTSIVNPFIQASGADQPTLVDYEGGKVARFGNTDFMFDIQGINGTVDLGTGYFEVDFRPRSISTNATGGSMYMNAGPLLDSGGYVGLPYLRSPSVDNEVAMDGNEDGTSSQVSTPIHLSYPVSIKSIHSGGNLSIQRDYRAPQTVASGNFNVGGLWRINKGFSAIYGDFESHSILISSAIPSASQQDGLKIFKSEKAWAKGYAPKISLPTRMYARVGTETRINFENIMVSNDWYPFSGNPWTFEVKVDGYTAGTVTSPNWTWTPSTATTTSTLTITMLRNGKRVGTASCPLTVVPATGSGIRRVSGIGDSWMAAPSNAGFSITQNIYADLTTAGFTVSMNGQRGSYAIIDGYGVDLATNRFNIVNHGLTANTPIQIYRTETTATYWTLASGTAFTDYPYVQKYVRDVPNANQFTISDTPGGTVNDFTSNGNGLFGIRRNSNTQDYNDALGGIKWSNVDGTNPIAGYDSPLIFNGRIDIPHYINTYCDGYAPTHVVFQLGINGGISVNIENLTQKELDNNSILRATSARIINAWRTASPNTKLIICMPSHQNILNSVATNVGFNRWQLMRLSENTRQVYLDLWGGRESENIYIYPLVSPDPFTDGTDAFHLVQSYFRIGKDLANLIHATP